MDPEPAQHEPENELGDQEWLHDRNLAIMQSEGLENERSRQRHPPQEPQGIAEQVEDQPPAGLQAWITGAGDVLSRDTNRVGQSGQQGKDGYHRRNDTDRRVRRPATRYGSPK